MSSSSSSSAAVTVPSREHVESLLSKGSHYTTAASTTATLGSYVTGQASYLTPYHFEANRALLKAYQFRPSLADVDQVALVLLLSLVQFSDRTTDFAALSYLVPDRVQKASPVRDVLRCHELLESCSFGEFWEALHGLSTSSAAVGVFAGDDRTVTALRRGVVRVLSWTYRTAPLSTVIGALQLPSSNVDLVPLLQNDPCVRSVDGGIVEFVPTPDNTKRGRVFQEGVSYTALANLMSKVSAAPQ
jgi:translation initiation factor 3 subunit K